VIRKAPYAFSCDRHSRWQRVNLPSTRRPIDDQREAVGEIIAGTAVEAHARPVLSGNNPKTIVLDLVQPLAAGRQFCGFDGKAWRDEPGRKGTRIKLGNGDCNFTSQSPRFLLGSSWSRRAARHVVASPGPSLNPRRVGALTLRSLHAILIGSSRDMAPGLRGADRTFSTRGPWLWSSVGSR
jgi:hypothetical protein